MSCRLVARAKFINSLSEHLDPTQYEGHGHGHGYGHGYGPMVIMGIMVMVVHYQSQGQSNRLNFKTILPILLGRK